MAGKDALDKFLLMNKLVYEGSSLSHPSSGMEKKPDQWAKCGHSTLSTLLWQTTTLWAKITPRLIMPSFFWNTPASPHPAPQPPSAQLAFSSEKNQSSAPDFAAVNNPWSHGPWFQVPHCLQDERGHLGERMPGMKMPLWFLRQECFSNPSPPLCSPYCSLQLKPSSNKDRQVESLHHLGIDYTCRWKPSYQNEDISFARGFSLAPCLGPVPTLTLLHVSIPALHTAAWQAFILTETLHFTCLQLSRKAEEFQNCFTEQHWATQHHWQPGQAENNSFFVSMSDLPVICNCLLTFLCTTKGF